MGLVSDESNFLATVKPHPKLIVSTIERCIHDVFGKIIIRNPMLLIGGLFRFFVFHVYYEIPHHNC